MLRNALAPRYVHLTEVIPEYLADQLTLLRTQFLNSAVEIRKILIAEICLNVRSTDDMISFRIESLERSMAEYTGPEYTPNPEGRKP